MSYYAQRHAHAVAHACQTPVRCGVHPAAGALLRRWHCVHTCQCGTACNSSTGSQAVFTCTCWMPHPTTTCHKHVYHSSCHIDSKEHEHTARVGERRLRPADRDAKALAQSKDRRKQQRYERSCQTHCQTLAQATWPPTHGHLHTSRLLAARTPRADTIRGTQRFVQ